MDGALSLAQYFHVAVLVRQYLEFDMPWRPHELLEIDVGVGEGRARLLLRLRQQIGQLLRRLHHAHPAPAPAGRRLDEHRIADLLRHRLRFLGGPDHAFRARQNRDTGALHGRARFLLEPHHAGHVRRWADELDPGIAAHFGKAGVLAEESVARMDGLDVGDFRRADDRRNIEIAPGALGRPDANGFVGKTHV